MRVLEVFVWQANGSPDRFSRHPEVLGANGPGTKWPADDKLY
jgi:hypothetical protein